VHAEVGHTHEDGRVQSHANYDQRQDDVPVLEYPEGLPRAADESEVPWQQNHIN